MARDSSPPDSPLSSMASTEAYEEEDGHDFDETASRPSKRQKVEAGSTTSSAVIPDVEPEAPEHPPLDGLSDVSSDTSGDIPSSPPNARLDEEDFQEQITKCEWDGCQQEGHKDMDDLVKHIHDAHIESRQKKYTCEWLSCTRKGMPHASGYALKAHMRSHTREKPFYCYLPECDRSFTRSDALAKHMRTVHETDALKPAADPTPKSTHGVSAGKSKLKIIIKRAQSQGLDDSLDEAMNGGDHADLYTVLSKDLFSAEELASSTQDLYRKCYWEAKWAEEIGDSLRKECQDWEEAYHKEWLEKEALVAQVIESEIDWHTRRQAVLSGVADVQVTAPVDVHSDASAGGSQEGADDDRSHGSVENGLLRPGKEATVAQRLSSPAAASA